MGRVVISLLGNENEGIIGKWYQLKEEYSDTISEVSQLSSAGLTLPLAIKLKKKFSSMRKRKMEN